MIFPGLKLLYCINRQNWNNKSMTKLYETKSISNTGSLLVEVFTTGYRYKMWIVLLTAKDIYRHQMGSKSKVQFFILYIKGPQNMWSNISGSICFNFDICSNSHFHSCFKDSCLLCPSATLPLLELKSSFVK